MPQCPELACGHVNRPSARFCEKCGRSLRDRRWSPLQSGHLMDGGAYRILEPLGKGGMGALYLAADTGAFDRQCVVKELLDYYDPTDPKGAQQAQARFETEGRLLAQLSHPGIPRIYRFFTEAGRHFIVMEYIEGETLERGVSHVDALGHNVPARPLSPEEVTRHAIRVCRVLEYLADQPKLVVHHDIKPANLIVDHTSGEVRLVDFGTAGTRTQWAAQARLEKGASTVFGTPGYAAPEQYQGQSEPRSDVFALAATAYHLLTDDDPGEHPFQFPKLGTLPQPLADALARAMRLDVQRRSTALEFRHALEAWLIPNQAAQPFVFRSGAVAHTTEELVTLCDRNWSDARQHLVDGDFDQWFRSQNRHDLVAKARSAKLERNTDASLETFLRRLNPRLPPPRLSVDPKSLDFGWVSRSGLTSRHLTVRNTGRGYGQLSLTASVPWIQFDPVKVGCLAGGTAKAKVLLDASQLSLRREHQGVIAATATRGGRISIPVSARMGLISEFFRRAAIGFGSLGRLSARGARQGLGAWTRTFRSLLRSRYGIGIVAAEALLLAAALVWLWWTVQGRWSELQDLLVSVAVAVPVALVAVYLLPAAVFVGGAILRELIRSLMGRTRSN